MSTVAERQHNDLLDFIIEGCQKVVETPQVDGTILRQLELDPERAYWKGHLVNSPTFARFVFELKEFEHLAIQANNCMTKKRAKVISEQILEIVDSFRYSIDAKSSESLRDMNNTQSTLIDKINRNKIEKAYTVRGDAKKSFLDGLLGKDGQREDED